VENIITIDTHYLPYPKFNSVSDFPLEHVFFDVWGMHPSRLVENNIMSVLLMIIVSLPRPIRSNSNVFQNFHKFQNLVEHLFDRKILVAQTNWGREYHNY
jgi:hypothetical protein